MPIFKYSGYRADGTVTNGSLEASGYGEAVAKVRAEGVFPREVAESGAAGRRGILRRTDQSLLPHITRQLSSLLSTGVPLMESLQAIAAEQKGASREMLITIKERVAAGASLAKSLEEFRRTFPEFYVHMVHAGEQSGTLDKVLLRLADFLESQNSLKARVRSAMIYPLLMIGVSLVVLSFLFTFVLPKIVKIFRDTKATLPLLTKILIALNTFLTDYWWVAFAAVAAAVVYLRKAVRTKRLYFDRLLLKIPGNLLQSLYLSRFARTLAFLLEGGLPILKALELSAKSTGNSHIETTVHESGKKVAEGQSLSATLDGFPPVFVQLVSTGERTGRLAATLDRAAQSYEEEFHRKVSRAIALFEPAIILAMGIVVLFIVLAVLLPMFQLNQLVR